MDVSQSFDLKVDCRLVLVYVEDFEEIRTVSGYDAHVLVPLTLKECQITVEPVLLGNHIRDAL